MPVSDTTPRAVDRAIQRFDQSLDALAAASPFARSAYQTDVFQAAEVLLGSDAGIRALASCADRFDDSHVFDGGPWADPARLRAQLVGGSLRASGVYPVVEILSELRMLAIAGGDAASGRVDAADATEFLREAMTLNLDLVLPGGTEAERVEGGPHRAAASRMFRLVAERLGLGDLRRQVVAELEDILAQRPITTGPVVSMVRLASRIPDDADGTSGGVDADRDRLARLEEAISGPTPLSRRHPGPRAYRSAVRAGDAACIEEEAAAFVASARDTGIVAPGHAVLLRHVERSDPDRIPLALGLDDAGTADYAANTSLVRRLIRVAVLPGVPQSVLGLAETLERGLISRQAVAAGLVRLVDLDLQPSVRRDLLTLVPRTDGISANAILLAGTLEVLGRPLGVGQGGNPTCQAARGISLWAEHAPAYLLELLVSAARDGFAAMPLEGEYIRSDAPGAVAAKAYDLDLDPVSLVLVPHLDRIYAEMVARVSHRHEDAHKWVNPALYGRWVPTGFASVFADLAQTTVTDHDSFVRRFFATHHPGYDAGHPMTYPNPVGLCVTNSHGDHLGPHAVSLLRVAESPGGTLRAYFYNPNNEGRQDWGGDVRTSVSGHGELPGESSLPFAQFVSRLYAFHYNPYEEGDAFAVPEDEAQAISTAARETWGRSFQWIQ